MAARAPASAATTREAASTRERLLQSAGEVFAERGLRGATVREICRRAGANVAAVNYHFRDKQTFYVDVLRHAQTRALAQHPPDGGLAADAGADQRLRAFIRSLLARVKSEGQPAWHGRLMGREMADPSAAIDVIVRETIRPQFERICAIVRDLLGPGASDDDVVLGATSVVGQCLYWFFAAPVVERLPALKPFRGEAALERLVQHVHRFSRAALANLAALSDPAKRR